MIIIGVITTIAVGIFGGFLGYETMSFPEMGIITAIAVMGGFIMAEIKKLGDKQNKE
jgi:hypothetical protein